MYVNGASLILTFFYKTSVSNALVVRVKLKMRCTYSNYGVSICMYDISQEVNTYLSPYVIDKAIHAGLHTKGMLTWQKFGVAVSVQTHATC